MDKIKVAEASLIAATSLEAQQRLLLAVSQLRQEKVLHLELLKQHGEKDLLAASELPCCSYS